MADKRILVIDSEVAKLIDENRGELSQSDFIKYIIDSHLKGTEEESTNNKNYLDREEFERFAEGMKDVIHHFLEFFLSYGLELGRQPQGKTFTELSQKLAALDARTKKL